MKRFLFVWAVMSMSASFVSAGEFVWVEGEEPAMSNFQWKTTNWPGNEHFSAGKWLLQTDRKNLDENGLQLQYDLDVPKDGTYDLWLRIGYEWVRPKVSWRLDDGKWTTVGLGDPVKDADPDDPGQRVDYHRLSTNVKSWADWTEVAWWNIGTATLRAGKRELHLKFTRTHAPNPLLAMDAICLVAGPWVPEGKLKPGEEYDGQDDRKAAAMVYRLPEPDDGARRVAVQLDGLWQLARYDDPDMDAAPTEPVTGLPADDELHWMGINVPGSLWSHPETTFAHRVIYRTKVDVPAAHKGRGFKLHFSGTNWSVSVFVNGQLAGTHRGVWIPWDLDVSKFIEPGKANGIAIAVKGPYYAIDTVSMGGDLVHRRNIPRSRLQWIQWIAPIYPSSKGDGVGADFGIVNPVRLESVGAAYLEDVFIKTSVAKKRLETDVTVRNTGAGDGKLSVTCEAVNDRTQEVEKSFGPVDVTVPAGGAKTVTVAGAWADPKLWWPKDNPDLYRLRTTTREGDKVLDVQEELFGFREVTVEGTGIYINGMRRNLWNWVNVAGRTNTGEEWLAQFRKENNRFTRFGANRKTSRLMPSREERLEFYDRNGVAGRLCSMIDGMFISFTLVHKVRDPETNEDKFVPNEPMWEGFRQHMRQLARAYRNHPSVIMYQVENELIYINGQNRHDGAIDEIQDEMGKVIQAARDLDPTRPYTVGGGGDSNGHCEINCPHYAAGDLGWYPDNAYTVAHVADHVKRWPWKKDKPWLVGESAWASELQYSAYVVGDETFRSRIDADRGKAGYLRMLYGGWRYAGAAGFCPWVNLQQHADAQKVFSDLCVIPRKQTHRLFAGRRNEILVKVMNDTFSAEPVTFEWSYAVGGEQIAGEAKKLTIEPGFGAEQTLVIAAPPVSERAEGVLTLKATQPGAPDYLDERSVPVLPAVKSVRVKAPVVLFDRSGTMAPFLERVGVQAEEIRELKDLKGKSGCLIVGPRTLTPREAVGQDLLRFALQGNRVIVLEQTYPAMGSNLPMDMKSTAYSGGYAHPQALGTPVLRDLGAQDLIDWAGDHPTYLGAYLKPSRGARSLVQCGDALQYTPLLVAGCGEGTMVLCQLRVGEKLELDPAADVLARNLIEHYADYRPPSGVVGVYNPTDAQLVAAVRSTGVRFKPLNDVSEGLDAGSCRVLVVKASKDELVKLDGLRDRLAVFQEAGGWVMLCGLEPDGLEAFNKLMGTDFLIRPYRVERTTLERPDFKLAAGLGNRDVAMFSARHLQHGRMWVSDQVFSYCIDAGDDVAPFCLMPNGPADPMEYTPNYDDEHPDQAPYNFVNSLLNSDHWKYIRQVWVPEGGAAPLIFKLRKPETLSQVRIWNNANYWTITELEVIFDGDAASAVRVPMGDGPDLSVAKLPRPRRVEKTVTLQIVSWREKDVGRDDLRLVGIDNVQVRRATAPEGAVAIDSVGGLVAFPRGKGGVFLNQLRFLANEPNPENAQKKSNILSLVLQNMGAGIQGARAIAVPGLNVSFEPLNLTKSCNFYMHPHADKPGWFVKGEDFQAGKQHLANVLYHVPDYATAPVPDCIVLGATYVLHDMPKDVRGIPVGKKADVLFFLHSAGISYPIWHLEIDKMRANPDLYPQAAGYVLNYADGTSATISVQLERHIQTMRQQSQEPQLLQGANVAWTSPTTRDDRKIAVIYSMKAINPRPDVVIKSIDLLQGRRPDGKIHSIQRGAIAVFGITLGTIVGR